MTSLLKTQGVLSVVGSRAQTGSSPIAAQALRPLSSESTAPQALWALVPFLNKTIGEAVNASSWQLRGCRLADAAFHH